MKTFKKVIEEFTKLNKTISTMESCTGGGVVNALTNIEGASEVIKFSAVTYSNEFKVKMGVPEEIIDKYSVYSMETAKAMSKTISEYTASNIGIGITGKLNRVDVHNPFGDDNVVFISIYDKDSDSYDTFIVEAKAPSRSENKELVIEKIIEHLEKKVIS